jgi:hypothetical protein
MNHGADNKFACAPVSLRNSHAAASNMVYIIVLSMKCGLPSGDVLLFAAQRAITEYVVAFVCSFCSQEL